MYGQHPAQAGQSPARTPGIAIASLVLGAGGFILLLLCSIPAIITGHIALRRINRSNGALGGSGLAIAGLVLGYLSTLFSMFAVSVGIAAFASGRQAIQQAERNKADSVCASLETAILAFHADVTSW